MGIRSSWIDNTKLVLITLVVTGHLLGQGAMDNSCYARACYSFIYSFHMPLFLFLSGLVVNKETLRLDKTITRFLYLSFLGILLKFMNALPAVLFFDPVVHFDLLSDNSISWFVLVLAAYAPLTYLLKDCNPLFVGVVALVLALFAGYDSAIGSFLNLSRAIVFFPYYWFGVSLPQGSFERVVSAKGIRVFGIILFSAFFIVSLYLVNDIFSYTGLFKGCFDYASCGLSGCTWINRAFTYPAALLGAFGFISIIPRRYFAHITGLGRNTLSIYMFHILVVGLLVRFGVIATVLSQAHGWLLLFPFGIVIALVLAQKCFMLPLNNLRKLIKVQSI